MDNMQILLNKVLSMMIALISVAGILLLWVGQPLDKLYYLTFVVAGIIAVYTALRKIYYALFEYFDKKVLEE